MSITLVCLILLVILVGSQVLWIMYNGSRVPTPTIPRTHKTQGTGSALTYVILGDSTTVAQGGDYEEGYPVATADFLSKTNTVTWQNFSISGARAHDIATKQAPQAAALKPDIALIAVGANDVTHLTHLDAVEEDLKSAVNTLRKSNPNVVIILTGSPDMGSVPRLPQPARWLAGERTKQLNKRVAALCKSESLIFAPIAEKTGPTFRKHPELFAPDNFHPAKEGYDLWTPVIIDAIKQGVQ